MRKLWVGLSLLLVTAAGPVLGQESNGQAPAALRELCTERPGLTTAACTVDPGHLQMEIGMTDWEGDKDSEEKQDRIKLGDVQLRYGLAAQSELQLSWPVYVHTVEHDYRTGAVERSHGVGDVTIGLKQNLRHPQEKAKGLALGILPYLSLPTGTHGGGDGDWSVGAVVPLSYKFSDLISVAVSPRIEAAVDEDRSGRHLAFGTAAGLQLAICDGVRLSPEVEIMRDRDPVQSATTASAAVSVAWKVADMTQLDIQGIAGLNAATPDVRLALGVSHKF